MKYGFVNHVDGIDFSLPPIPAHLQSFTAQNWDLRIGPSVWADKDYVGNYFPIKTPQKDFLKAYSSQFNTVEVNATRYGTPKASTLLNWKDQAQDGFKFSFKMPQIISQRKDLLALDVLQRLDEFVLAMDSMGNKAGRTFILLQNNFDESRIEELNTFLSHLPQEQKFALEVRHSTFNKSKELADLLNSYNIANVVTDTAGMRQVVHTNHTAGCVYIRFVGNGLVPTDYARIKAWTNHIKALEQQGYKEVYFLVHQPDRLRRESAIAAHEFITTWNSDSALPKIKAPINYATNQTSLF